MSRTAKSAGANRWFIALAGTALQLCLGTVTPVATVAKWFPDKKGLTTGMVIMGFGFGAFLMSKLFAPLLYQAAGGDLVMVFAWLGIGFLVGVVSFGAVLRNPPPGFRPAAADAPPAVAPIIAAGVVAREVG